MSRKITSADKKTIQLPDGRNLSYLEYGTRDGSVLILIHGTPFSSLMWKDINGIKGSKFRIIAVDRPGYGHSTYNMNGSLENFPEDLKHLIRHLNLKSVNLAGVSGGGPYVLQCALKIPELLEKVGIISSVGPYEKEAIGDMNANRNLYKLARIVPGIIAFQNQQIYKMIQKDPLKFINLGKKKLAGKDLAFIERKGFAERLADSYADGCRQKSSTKRNPMTDDIFYTANWQIPLQDIKKEIYFFWGDKDRSIGNQCKYMAELIPNAHEFIFKGEGHFLVYEAMDEILANF